MMIYFFFKLNVPTLIRMLETKAQGVLSAVSEVGAETQEFSR